MTCPACGYQKASGVESRVVCTSCGYVGPAESDKPSQKVEGEAPKGWAEMHANDVKLYNLARMEITRLKAELEQAKHETKRCRDRIGTLETNYSDKLEQLEQAKNECDVAENTAVILQQDLAALQEQLTQVQAEQKVTQEKLEQFMTSFSEASFKLDRAQVEAKRYRDALTILLKATRGHAESGSIDYETGGSLDLAMDAADEALGAPDIPEKE